jgi:DNA helicase-2/ATP-dependent DNA helicase PcrA
MATHFLDRLNPAQREAATRGDGPLLIIAGAGTGKTMTLACRVGHLLERGVPPERILLLTFTRRAAREMIRRAADLTGTQNAARVWGGTFHATANRLLRMYGSALGLADEFTVCDQADAGDLMNMIRAEREIAKGKRRFPKKGTLVAIYSRTVSAQEKLSEVLTRQFPWCRDEIDGIREIFDGYTTRKRERNVLDYDDLLLYWRLLATESPAAQAVRQRFEHILVDEYQDTNIVQRDILLAMRADNPNLSVVGDDAQAIYSFRAATVRNILDFPKDFPGATIVKLEQNYRSTQPILAASNAVMSEARERYTKHLHSQRTSAQKPLLVHTWDEDGQCQMVCDHILRHREEGIPLMRQAVLFRAGHHSDMLEVELGRRNIPFHKFGGLKFIESAHIKDLLAVLRIVENPTDEISWHRVLLLIDGIGPRSARRITADLLGGDGSPLARLRDQPPSAPPAAREAFAQLRTALLDCAATPQADGDGSERNAAGAPSLAHQLEIARRFYEPIFEKTYDNATMRLRDIEQLEHIAEGYRSRTRFLTDLTLDPPASTSDLAQPPHLDDDYLVLSTIHSAKGCEWDVVHVLHAADGMIPSDMAVEDADGVEEERRLLYVAMTRARDWLYLYFPLRYYHRKHGLGDAHSFAQLSRFLGDAVRKHLEERTLPIDADDPRGAFQGDARRVDTALRKLWE